MQQATSSTSCCLVKVRIGKTSQAIGTTMVYRSNRNQGIGGRLAAHQRRTVRFDSRTIPQTTRSVWHEANTRSPTQSPLPEVLAAVVHLPANSQQTEGTSTPAWNVPFVQSRRSSSRSRGFDNTLEIELVLHLFTTPSKLRKDPLSTAAVAC